MFEIRDSYYLNGEPYQIISGALHYFRVVPEYWMDRLEKPSAMNPISAKLSIPWKKGFPYGSVRSGAAGSPVFV